MEEQRARQEAEARKAATEVPGDESAAAQTGEVTLLYLSSGLCKCVSNYTHSMGLRKP